jgi:hypothetical protein
MRKRIEMFKVLSLSDWKILLSASFLLPLVALSLKLKGLKKTQLLIARYCHKPSPFSKLTPLQVQEAKRIANLVSISANHGIFRTNCLKQVLVLSYYLNKKGIASTLHIGVRKSHKQLLDAHAWLECAGQPLINSKNSLQQFSSILSSKS